MTNRIDGVVCSGGDIGGVGFVPTDGGEWAGFGGSVVGSWPSGVSAVGIVSRLRVGINGVRKVILLVAQSIIGLLRASQSCPRTIVHSGSNEVTKKVQGTVSPDGNIIGESTASVIVVFDVPSNKRSRIGSTSRLLRLCARTNVE